MSVQTRTLFVAIALTATLYVVPYGRVVAYPLVLLSTLAHEMGHGITALLVGGEFLSLEIHADASGLAHVVLPDRALPRALTAAGGLLGPSLLAAGFFRLARRASTAAVVLQLFGAGCLVAVALWVRGIVGMLFTTSLGVACVLVGHRSTQRSARLALAFMAIQLSLSVFSRGDYLFTVSAGSGPSDVSQIAEALFLPYWLWGTVCGLVALVVLTYGMRSFLLPRSRN